LDKNWVNGRWLVVGSVQRPLVLKQSAFGVEQLSTGKLLLSDQCGWNKAFRRVETLFVQGRNVVQNLFTIYIVKEINACFTHKSL